MKERPILFSAPMVRAILEGRKTQTRRGIKQATGLSLSVGYDEGSGEAELSWLYGDGPGYDVHEYIKRVRCPYGQPGERLWVREKWSGNYAYADEKPSDRVSVMTPDGPLYRDELWYWADGDPDWGDWERPRPSIHMPRWASRITLEVAAVRIERLQDISEADACAEGARECDPVSGREVLLAGPSQRGSFVLHYRDIWEQINGPGSWDANPWVWVVEFARVQP